MASCEQCGKQIEGYIDYCTKCGEPTGNYSTIDSIIHDKWKYVANAVIYADGRGISFSLPCVYRRQLGTGKKNREALLTYLVYANKVGICVCNNKGAAKRACFFLSQLVLNKPVYRESDNIMITDGLKSILNEIAEYKEKRHWDSSPYHDKKITEFYPAESPEYLKLATIFSK